MDISEVTFDVDGRFNSGNALHALFIYHDMTHEKIIQIDKILRQSYEINIKNLITCENILIKSTFSGQPFLNVWKKHFLTVKEDGIS